MRLTDSRRKLATAMKKINGPAIFCSIMRAIDPVFRKKLLAELADQAPHLAALAEHTSFVFADLTRLDDRSLQSLIRMFKMEQWALAWKLSPNDLKVILLQNMSNAAKAEFLQTVKTAPKVHKSVVIRQQMEIARKAHNLLCQGKLKLQNRQTPSPAAKAS